MSISASGRALVVTDPNLTRLAPVHTVLAALDAAGVEAVLYDRVRVEPTDVSFRDAIQFAEAHPVDGIVAVGGGSVIDTAKAVNLYTTYPPADFLDYVNAPIGKAMPVPGPLKPLIAIPTTAGTGSETTGVSIFDLTEMHAKTGIASRRLKPTLGAAGSRQHADDAAAGGGVERARHPEPCHRVVHGDAVYVASPPRESGAASGLPGVEPDQRHLGASGAANRRAVPRRAPSRIRPTTRRARR